MVNIYFYVSTLYFDFYKFFLIKTLILIDFFRLFDYNILTMKIINEFKFNNVDALRLSSSTPEPRKNNMRIHYHAFIEISLILRGNGLYKTNDNVYTISQGDLFFFRPNEAHCITDIEEQGMEILNLHIAPYYLYSNIQNAMNTNYVKILASNFPLMSNKINDTLPQEQIDELKNLMLSIRREFTQKRNDYLTVVNNYISLIFIFSSRPYKKIQFSKSDKLNHQKMLQAIKYIDTHYKEELTLDTLAKKVSYSKCYFSSIFKKCMGMSIWDYISIKRIEEALTQIRTTEKNIADIAFDCGFNNVGNFNKLFKKYTNVTPNFFRK